MDRLDTWIGTQRGWRLLVLRCVALAPFGVAAGSLWSILGWDGYQPGTPQVNAVTVRIVSCVAISFAIAALTMLPRRWSGNTQRVGSGWWRLTVAQFALFAGLALLPYENAEPLAWHHRHFAAVFGSMVAVWAVAVVLILWQASYAKHLRRAPEWPGEL